VVGYSWLDVVIPQPNTTGVGFTVAWVSLSRPLVSECADKQCEASVCPRPGRCDCGIVRSSYHHCDQIVTRLRASVASFLPPSTTIRKYHRKLVSTTCSELGSIYCQIVSFANSRRQTEVPEIVTNLLAVRRKLRKAQAVRQNARYEVH